MATSIDGFNRAVKTRPHAGTAARGGDEGEGPELAGKAVRQLGAEGVHAGLAAFWVLALAPTGGAGEGRLWPRVR